MSDLDHWWPGRPPVPPARLKVCRGRVYGQWDVCGYVHDYLMAERVFAKWERDYPDSFFALYSDDHIVLPSPPGTLQCPLRLPGRDGRLLPSPVAQWAVEDE